MTTNNKTLLKKLFDGIQALLDGGVDAEAVLSWAEELAGKDSPVGIFVMRIINLWVAKFVEAVSASTIAFVHMPKLPKEFRWSSLVNGLALVVEVKGEKSVPGQEMFLNAVAGDILSEFADDEETRDAWLVVFAEQATKMAALSMVFDGLSGGDILTHTDTLAAGGILVVRDAESGELAYGYLHPDHVNLEELAEVASWTTAMATGAPLD